MRSNYVFFSILVLAVIGRLIVSWLPLELTIQYCIPDDAFYYFSLARNIVAGEGITVDGVQPTNGFHPLWVGVLLLPYTLVKEGSLPIHIVLSIASLFEGATVLLCWRIGNRFSGTNSGGVLAAAFYAFNPWGALQSVNGLETSLATFFFALTIWIYLTRVRPRKPDWSIAVLFGCSLGFLLLARTDNILLLLVLGIDSFKMIIDRDDFSRISMLSLSCVVAGILLLPWLVWNLNTFGTIMQSSAVAVPLAQRISRQAISNTAVQPSCFFRNSLHQFVSLLFSLIRYGGVGGGVLFMFLLLSYLCDDFKRYFCLPLLLPIASSLLVLVVHSVARRYVRGWYFTPWVWGSSVYAGYVLSLVLQEGEGDFEWFQRVGIVCLSVIFIVQIVRVWHTPFYPWQRWTHKGSQWASTHTHRDSVLAAFNSGILTYFGRREVVNLDGVISWEAVQALQEQQLMTYLDSKQVDYLIDFEYFIFEKYASFFDGNWRSRLAEVKIWSNETYRFGDMGAYSVQSPDRLNQVKRHVNK